MSRIPHKRELIGAILLVLQATLKTYGLDEPSIPLRYETPKSLTGKIFAKDSDRKTFLFKFTRQSTRSGMTLNVLREYSYPDGKLAARERLTYNGDSLSSYELEELQIGASGRAEVGCDLRRPEKSQILFEYSNNASSKSKPKVDREPLRNDTLVNDMVGPFLAQHWDELIRGKEVKCRYIVVPRRETVGFTFKKDSEPHTGTRSVLLIKMEATSPIIAALIDPLFFTVEKDSPHRVLEYSGRTTPKILSGSQWKDLNAITVFDWPKAH